MADIAEDDAVLDRPAEPPGRRAKRRTLRRLTLALAGALVVGIAIGFVDFAETVSAAAPPTDPRAEGIVVLTGGTARIDGALALLAEGRATRLLISGLNPVVTRDTLAGTVPGELRPVLDCCVDVDHARDTIENAASTREWVSDLGFSSLIVVTSDYHMPRTMAELAGAMPGVRLIAFPVNSPEIDLSAWWRDSEVFDLLAREYGKYLVAEARQLFPSGRAANAAGL